MSAFRRISTLRTGPRRGLVLGAIGTAVAGLTIALATNASANLAGSNFEGNDGNLAVTTAGNRDWANVSPRNGANDVASGSSDNAFGGGSKEDGTSVGVTDGSIPPNKNDLTRFYESQEQAASGDIYVYLAWERLVNIGNANLDFEINQNKTVGFTASTTGAVNLNRTAGDMLVTYDFGGSGTPTIGLLRWVTGAHTPAVTGFATNACFSASGFPCWGDRKDLTASGFAQGAVNTGTIAESVAGGNLGTGLFGEAAINLTAAGVFTSGVCSAFGSTFVKSRSSSSFTAEMKDFIAPVDVNISNCGGIIIRKATENGDGDFAFAANGGTISPTSFSLSDGDSQSFSNVSVNSDTVTENLTQAQKDAGWTLKSVACTTTGAGTSSSVDSVTKVLTITEGFGGTADCTFTNHINAHPTISTTLSGNPVDVGSTVHDSATLSGATAHAGGSVTYTVYTDSACSQGAQAAGTKTVTDSVVPDSNGVQFNTAGDFYWQASYSGDGDNNTATSACTEEHLVVNKAQPSASTAQHLIPNDSFTLSGTTSGAGGSITFNLYAPSAPTCSGTPALTQTVSVSGNGTYDTSNTTFVASTAGTWRWASSYTGDGNNNGATSACGVENFTIANS